MSGPEDAAPALAALTVCESILLGLVDRGTISDDERRQILLDAAEAHRNLIGDNADAELHRRAATIIERMAVDGGGYLHGFFEAVAEPEPERPVTPPAKPQDSMGRG